MGDTGKEVQSRPTREGQTTDQEPTGPGTISLLCKVGASAVSSSGSGRTKDSGVRTRAKEDVRRRTHGARGAERTRSVTDSCPRKRRLSGPRCGCGRGDTTGDSNDPGNVHFRVLGPKESR